jgi:putative toxin-antitoxin system antitoxin component (TIGR02293 family)
MTVRSEGVRSQERQMVVASLYERIGKILGARMKTQEDAFLIVQDGLPGNAYKKLVAYAPGLTRVIISESTLRRRLRPQAKFTGEETEKLLRVSKLVVMAEEMFGDMGEAMRWLNEPADFIPERPAVAPIELARTEVGAEIVENALLRAAHGIY